MKEYKPLLNLFLDHLKKHRSGLSHKFPKELYAPEDYILSLGGKRLRPLLALIACDLFEKDPKLALDSALSVELFHNFSLIHDDILDQAPLRRNQATVHVKWNSNIAILSGDVMLVKALQVLQNYDAKQFKKLSKLVNTTAIQVCEGQQMDMNFEKARSVSVSEYIHMITLKTAVLLGCSLQMGAINASAGKKDQANIYAFGKHLGLSFQLLDDLLDVFAKDPEKFGKQSGGDILANKKTFLLLKALELADEKKQREMKRVLALKDKEGVKKVKGMFSLYRKLDVEQLCRKEATKHTKLAIGYLNKIKASKVRKENLKRFALELLNREI